MGLQAGTLARGLGAGPLRGVGELVQDVDWLFLLSLLLKQIRIKPPRLFILFRIYSPLPRPRCLRLGMIPSSEHLLHGCHLLLVQQRDLSCGFVLECSFQVALGLEAWEPFVGGEEEAPGTLTLLNRINLGSLPNPDHSTLLRHILKRPWPLRLSGVRFQTPRPGVIRHHELVILPIRDEVGRDGECPKSAAGLRDGAFHQHGARHWHFLG